MYKCGIYKTGECPLWKPNNDECGFLHDDAEHMSIRNRKCPYTAEFVQTFLVLRNEDGEHYIEDIEPQKERIEMFKCTAHVDGKCPAWTDGGQEHRRGGYNCWFMHKDVSKSKNRNCPLSDEAVLASLQSEMVDK